MRSTFQPWLPTAGKVVPSTPSWLYEVKYDGYRLIVAREGNRVRLFTRKGHDWSGRYPSILESALKNRYKQFVIDGEAVVLGIGQRRHLAQILYCVALITNRNGRTRIGKFHCHRGAVLELQGALVAVLQNGFHLRPGRDRRRDPGRLHRHR